MGIPALNQPVLHSFRMKRLAFSAFLLPLFLTAQQVPVGSGVPAPVQASASYQGKRGVQPIYYWVCTRFPSGYACMSQPAIASGTEGIGNLGGGNSVNLNWSAVVSGATGYDVIRQSSGGSFSGVCGNGCAIALNIHTTSYSDSSPSAGSSNPPAGLTPVMAAAGRIVLDNLDYATPTLVWVLAGITEPFCFPGSSGCGCHARPNGCNVTHQRRNPERTAAARGTRKTERLRNPGQDPNQSGSRIVEIIQHDPSRRRHDRRKAGWRIVGAG